MAAGETITLMVCVEPALKEALRAPPSRATFRNGR